MTPREIAREIRANVEAFYRGARTFPEFQRIQLRAWDRARTVGASDAVARLLTREWGRP